MTTTSWILLGVVGLIAYFIGNISPSTIMAKKQGLDIKKEGSGNAGTTNALRVMGKKAGAITCVVDILKGVVAVLIGSLIGAVLGSIIPFDVTGIDFSLTALFLTVFIEQWLSTKDHASALIGVAASVLSVVLFGADRFLLPAMAAILISLTVLRAVRKEAAHA